MSDLKETIADGTKVRRAAVDPTDVIRKQEFDAAVNALNPGESPVFHNPVTVVDTNSVDMTLSGQEISAAIRTPAGTTIQAAGGPDTEDFSPVSAGVTLTLAKDEVTLDSVRRYNSSDVLAATGVEGVDYELDPIVGSIYIPTGSNLVTNTGDYVRVVYIYDMVEDTSGLTVTSGGVRVTFGNTYGTAARGDHRHPNDHKPATGGSTNSADVTVTPGQVATVDVRLDPAGNLEETVNGLAVASGAFAEPTHSHPEATTDTAGFMSPADKQKLDGIDANAADLTFSDTVTIDLTRTANDVTADIKYGAGLVVGSDGLRPDWQLVAAKDHTHSESVQWGEAGSNFRFKDGQFQLWDDLAYAADPAKPWRALGVEAGQLFLSDPIAD